MNASILPVRRGTVQQTGRGRHGKATAMSGNGALLSARGMLSLVGARRERDRRYWRVACRTRTLGTRLQVRGRGAEFCIILCTSCRARHSEGFSAIGLRGVVAQWAGNGTLTRRRR